ncbi:peroxiredoxin-like family protein [Streptomyces sp. NPDC046712]|uniref:peroxiredoxin-like family protein n=1 Tax=Streptomyces sp. NPDC046712 TaxID=3154802 RepID=UPI0033D066A6
MSTTRLTVGDRAPDLGCATLGGETLSPVGRPGRTVILKFYRFANCPLCNLHVREWVRRADEVRAAGLTTLAVFHSPVEALRSQLLKGAEIPFDVLADPEKRLFRAYGVEESLGGMFHGKVMSDNMRAMGAGYLGMMPFGHEGGIRGHPADFLIGPDGVVRMAHYGAHYADTLSVDAVLAAATTPTATTTPAPPPMAEQRQGARR